MTFLRRPRAVIAALAATLLLTTVAVPSADAWWMPRPTHYRPGGAITLDTNLVSDSGASAWAINAYLAANTSLPPLGEAFLAAEAKYGVNAKFLLAAAMHESGMGSSDIARIKHNLFGYNAYDRDPFRYASAYGTFAANINATAKFIRDFYLTPTGRWWGGAPTLRSMQQFWSSSGRWGERVAGVANSIHLATFPGRRLKFSMPIVRGGIHGGDRVRVRVTWSGGTIPAGTAFVATWVPTALDADVVAATNTSAASASTGAPSADTLSVDRPSIMVAASRIASSAHSATLSLAAPRAAGSYQLRIDLRDTGRGVLPKAERVRIPAVATRVWGDRSVSVELAASDDGSGAVITVTNTGRVAIPAAPKLNAAASADPEAEAVRSVVTVTAASSNASDGTPVLLLSSPLTADLAPGASTTFTVPAVHAATGRSTSWLEVTMSVLGDPTLLAAYAPVGAWLSDASAAGTFTMQPALPYDGPAAPAASPASAVTAAPSPGATQGPPAPTPTATPTATPAPKPTPTPAPRATPKPTAAPSLTPKPTAKPIVKHVLRTIGDRSSAIRYRGGWSTASGPYQGGSATYATSAGATATITFTGNLVRWIGPLGPTRGTARVILDGRVVATISLWRSDFIGQAVLFSRSFRTSGRHTLTIKVLSSPGHPYVAIDGFVVRS